MFHKLRTVVTVSFILIVYRSDIFSKYLSLHRDKPKVDNPIKLLE